MTGPIKFLHVDDARKFTGHATRRAFYMWFRRATRRHPEVNVLYRHNYIEESAFHLLNAADSKPTASPQTSMPTSAPSPVRPINGNRLTVLPLTRGIKFDN